MNLINKQHAVTLLLYLFTYNYATADELYLKNGDRITGEVINISTTRCIFKTDYQATLHIKRSEILRLNMIQAVANVDTEPVSLIPTSKLLSVRAKGAEEPAKQTEKKSKPSNILGEEPDEDLQQIFLRQSTILLKPGKKELDISLNYTRYEYANLRSREWTLPVSLRFGITDRLEGFIDVPFSWAQREVFHQNSVDKNNVIGIGDFSAGLKYLFKRQDKQWPDIIGSFSISAPTGDDSDPQNINDVPIGSGHWHMSTGLTLVKSYDPAVLFGSIGYIHSLKKTINGLDITPGKNFYYSFGMGFAINNQISISGQFIGAYQTGIQLDGIDILGASREPMSLRTGLTFRIGKGQYLEPVVTFGLNDDALDATLGLSYTHALNF